MKRKDLKPGDQFYYTDTPSWVFHADVRTHKSVLGLAGSQDGGESQPTHGSINWERDVILVSAEGSLAAMAASSNPKQAYGDKKAALHLVPPALCIGAAKGMKEGAAKYGAYNWRASKVEYLTYLGAIMRHAAAILDGEDVDPESTTGKLHLEGIAANVAIALDAWYGKFLVDNRPAKGPAPEMLRTPK